MSTAKFPAVLGAVFALSIVGTGCATKKHVREAIAPVQGQVNDVQKQTADNKSAIGDLDRQVATADEKASDAGRRAGSAADAAAKANDSAMQAGQRADNARSLAEQGMSRLDKTIQNLDNYHLVTEQKIMFRVGRAELSTDAKMQLDAAVQQVTNMKSYIVEVEGFADKSGRREANLELSRKRAESVVRYLTLNHNVPLRRIHDVGVGAEDPNADNKTRAARKENRRVDVKVYALDLTNQPASGTTGGQ